MRAAAPKLLALLVLAACSGTDAETISLDPACKGHLEAFDKYGTAGFWRALAVARKDAVCVSGFGEDRHQAAAAERRAMAACRKLAESAELDEKLCVLVDLTPGN